MNEQPPNGHAVMLARLVVHEIKYSVKRSIQDDENIQ